MRYDLTLLFKSRQVEKRCHAWQKKTMQRFTQTKLQDSKYYITGVFWRKKLQNDEIVNKEIYYVHFAIIFYFFLVRWKRNEKHKLG